MSDGITCVVCHQRATADVCPRCYPTWLVDQLTAANDRIAELKEIIDYAHEKGEQLTADLAAQTARAERAADENTALRRIARAYVSRMESDYPESYWGEDYHQAVAILAGGAKVVRCPECLQDAPTAAEIDHGDDCEAAP